MKPKQHKLAITVDDNGASIIHDAIDRHQEASGMAGKTGMAADGRTLVAICTEWQGLAEARIRAAKS